MIGQWLVYGLAVSLLVSGAAWLAEQGARAQRWPARWVWLGAMVVSLAVPLAAVLAPAGPESVPSLVAAPTAAVLQSIPLDLGPAPASGPSPTMVALAGWLGLSALLLAALGVLGTRLLIRRRGWSRRRVEGVDVWVSRNTGPAALGVLRAAVVVPEWALELAPARRRLLVLHEAEHVRARDPQLAVVGLLLAVLVPWNLPLWWQLRRLRLAIEVDCDRRVLRRAEDARGYGSLLLDVCQRKSHLALALAESTSMLERRIRMITKATRGPATVRAVGLTALAGVVLAVACETPAPTSPADAGPTPLDIEAVRTELGDAACDPVWFINGSRSSIGVVDALEPAEVASVHVFNAEQVRQAEDVEVCGLVSILTGTATPDEEAAARRIVEQMMAGRRAAAGQEDPAVPTLEEVREGPTFTPMTVRPQLRNAAEVRSALDEVYPPLLREAGIGGTTNVWFLIDTEGRVEATLINQSSGYDALDRAALRVADVMEFTPAYNRDRRTPVWVALDIDFEAEGVTTRTTDAQMPSRPAEGRVAGEAREPAAEPGPEPTRAPEGEPIAEGAAEPVFTPMTEQPRLVNNRETAERLEQYYPPLLRDAGIGGTANIWFHIDEDGRVTAVRINESSGYDALDAAALEVARGMEFSPAKNGAEPVDVWVAMDVTFSVQR